MLKTKTARSYKNMENTDATANFALNSSDRNLFLAAFELTQGVFIS